MKKFEAPEMEICRFDIQDIISASREDESGMDIITDTFELPITAK